MWNYEYDGKRGLPSAPEPENSCLVNNHLGPPEMEDCTSDTVPPQTESKAGTKKIMIPDLVSMWKYLLNNRYGNRRLTLYSYLNRALRNGELSKTVGFKVMNRAINREACELMGVRFWKNDRKNFYANVRVSLTLLSDTGVRKWEGYLVCWCCFKDDGFDCSVEQLTDDPSEDMEGFATLNPFLVPYYTNRMIDEIAASLWKKYGMEEALTDPEKRDAYELARRMGLSIEYHPVYEHKGVNSILFFASGPLIIGEDRIELQEDGSKEHIKANEGTVVTIPANTIVVNTNRVKHDYSAFNIFHECVHYELHYMFFRLQQMGNNDVRQVKTIEVEVEDGKEYSDPIYFMEKQANRGAYALMMPAQHTQQLIYEECGKVTTYQNFGEQYETAGISISDILCLPHFRVRARMIQLGHIEARGALNYVGRDRIQPFAFDPDAWQESEISFVIDPWTVGKLRKENKDFAAIMASGRYIYADGHVVRNDPRFVYQQDEEFLLTDLARRQVDVCCLRFIRQYVQQNIGQYVYGRMFYDPRYEERTSFYISDLVNEQQMDDLDAKMEYKARFPRSFVKAFDMLMKKNGESRESIAPKLHTTERSLHDWLYDPERRITLDFVVGVSLMWELPDWISKMLIDRAMIRVSEYDRRHQALEHIRTALWDQGIDAANKYLVSKGLAPLAI